MEVAVELVAEGPTDQVVISILLKATIRNSYKLIFKSRQPSDRTSARRASDEGGWQMVYKWCLNFGPEIRRHWISGGGLFEDIEPRFRILIVHLDTDLCDKDEFIRLAGISTNGYNLANPYDRGRYISDVLANWLWPEGNGSNDRKWTLLAPAAESTETWLVAALCDHPYPEELRHNDKELVEAYKKLIVANRDTIKKVPKKEKHYSLLANKAAAHIDKVLDRCLYFQKLANEFDIALS